MKTRNQGPSLVMPGLVPVIHVFASVQAKFVDGRDKPGHDDGRMAFSGRS
jgi:hypothetical protein